MLRPLACVAAVAATLLAARPAPAAVITITPADLAGATLIPFSPTPALGTPINGQTVSGVLFGFTINGIPSNLANIGGGPGNTNNITFPNVVSVNGTNAGVVLSLTFPTEQTRLGYGYAISSLGNVPNATTVDLFDSANNLVGTLSANGAPDPNFTGGFLGVRSDIPFSRAEVRFSTAGGQAAAFAFDNLRFQFVAADAIPEPATIGVFAALAGACGLAVRRRKSALA